MQYMTGTGDQFRWTCSRNVTSAAATADVNERASMRATMSAERGLGDRVTAGRLLLLLVVVMRMVSVDVVTGILLLPLGPPVLEPDLDLRLGEAERERETETLTDGQVASQPELALERRQLVVAERRSCPATAGPASAVVAADMAAAVAARICGRHVLLITTGTIVNVTTVRCV